MLNQLDLNISDIIMHPEFQKLKIQEHHYTSTVFDHSIRVAKAAHRTCHFFHINPKHSNEIIRAALLHDFYDFDRKLRREARKHASMSRLEKAKTCFLFAHPKSAAKHANELFDLNKRQTNAIKSHMFPFAPIPTTVDGWIVTYSDKLVSIKEVIEAIQKKNVFSW